MTPPVLPSPLPGRGAEVAEAAAPALPRASHAPRPEGHVLALEEMRIHGLERAAVLGAVLLLAGGLGWAALTRVPELAVGLGEIVPALAAAPLQHLEGGIVAEVMVEEGSLVEPGQPVLRMNDVAARAELAQARLRLASLESQSRRLAAAGEGADTAGLPEGLFLAPQRAALESRLQALADRRAVLREQAAQRQSELLTLEGQATALRAQIALHERELRTREELAGAGLTTRLAVLEARRLLMGASAEHDRLHGQHATVARALAEMEARIAELRSAAVDEARQEAARVALEMAETDEAVRRLEERAERTLLRAPIGGTLRGLAVHRPGTVLQPGALVAEILPYDAPLVADVRLAPRDIGFIGVGQAVNVKVQSFDYARFGTVAGRVERVSAGTFPDEQRQPHYRARVALSQEHVGHDPRQARLVPGMTVQADITTGTKTVLQYLLKPIYSAMAASFHER